MSEPTGLESMREIVRGLFPWASRIRVVATALRLGSATERLQLAGEGPAVARVGDLVVRLVRDSVSGTVYVSTDDAAPYTWTALASVVGAPLTTTAGTRVAVVQGSGKVVCA